MYRLPEDQVDAFEEHYFACPDCAIILQKTGACLEAMRAAAQKLRSEETHKAPASVRRETASPRATLVGRRT
jgi:anti-sigma factor RsiW